MKKAEYFLQLYNKTKEYYISIENIHSCFTQNSG